MSEYTVFEYEKDGAAIYRQSFATIRAEADLSGLPDTVAQVAVRMIHACGMTDLPHGQRGTPPGGVGGPPGGGGGAARTWGGG
ncbi:precorrin-8X methylmutase, partial [Streptomyces sp. NPDC059742]|uniref:precorrin-8X methylmutase n=1 Tax=Streptomyces sp. NPDC059742 TaxID=3346927 RepID=UPI0036533D02